MVAAKLLISLCVAGLTSAAPQSQGAIVNDVVTALQPNIARAVAEALRGLSSSRFTSSSSSSSRNSGSSFGASGSSFGQSGTSFGAAGSRFGATGAVGVASGAVEGPTARPEYNYEFKVADEAEQTFISQNEARDGDDVVGTYSYVDPNGDLITVNYQAGLDGYTQTLDKQVGAVEIRAKPVRVGGSTAATSSQSSRGSSSSFGSSSRGSTSSFGSSSRGSSGSFGSSSRGSTSFTTSSTGLNQSALIAQILSALQPQIAVAVNN